MTFVAHGSVLTDLLSLGQDIRRVVLETERLDEFFGWSFIGPSIDSRCKNSSVRATSGKKSDFKTLRGPPTRPCDLLGRNLADLSSPSWSRDVQSSPRTDIIGSPLCHRCDHRLFRADSPSKTRHESRDKPQSFCHNNLRRCALISKVVRALTQLRHLRCLRKSKFFGKDLARQHIGELFSFGLCRSWGSGWD